MVSGQNHFSVKPIVALTTRGLEEVSAGELATLPGVTVTQVAYRQVSATCGASLVPLLGLRTVDDVYLRVASWAGVERPRSTLPALEEVAYRLDLREAAALCSSLRPIGYPPTFYVSASFVGRRNYGVEDLKRTVGDAIATSHGWKHSPSDAEADLNVRLFIEQETAFVGVRLAQKRLRDRPYPLQHVVGTLKPPVAAALLLLAGVGAGARVLDPCCGAGTILIEAARYGAVALGGDRDPVAVAVAQANARAAGVLATVEQWDACRLPLADASVDYIVSDLPWGRQVVADTTQETFYRRAGTEMRRVLAPGGSIALLTTAPDLVNLSGLRCSKTIEISLFGQKPTITLFRPAGSDLGGGQKRRRKQKDEEY